MLSIRCRSKWMVTTKFLFIVALFFPVTFTATAQTASASYTFIDYQRSIPKITDLLKRKEDTLVKQFRSKGLVWPARYVYIRSFKYDSQLEVWVKNDKKDTYKLFKSYKVC